MNGAPGLTTRNRGASRLVHWPFEAGGAECGPKLDMAGKETMVSDHI